MKAENGSSTPDQEGTGPDTAWQDASAAPPCRAWQHIGRALRLARFTVGMSQVRLAAILSGQLERTVTQGHISKVERSRTALSLRQLELLSRPLGYRLSEICEIAEFLARASTPAAAQRVSKQLLTLVRARLLEPTPSRAAQKQPLAPRVAKIVRAAAGRNGAHRLIASNGVRNLKDHRPRTRLTRARR